MWKYSLLLSLLLIAHSVSDDVKNEFKKSFSKNCDNSYTLTCFKLDIVNWVEKLNEEDYSLLPGVSLVRDNTSDSANTAEIVSNLARQFPDDPEARLDVFLMKKLTGFINNHSIKLKLWGDSKDELGTARGKGGGGFGGGGGKGGGGGGLGYLLAAGAMMKGAMMAVGMAGVAAMAGKALMAALMAVMLAALAGLKGGGGGKTTYEVISKPVYTSSHSHSTSHEDYGGHGGGGGGHSGWGRSFSDQQLPKGLQPDYKPGQ